jgi:branched-chain amino acid transport system permease protein
MIKVIRKYWKVILILPLVSPPFFLGKYGIYLLNLIGINMILALGLNLVMGYAGQINLAHAAFFGIGSYAAAFFSGKFGIPFYFSIPLGGIIAAIIGIPIALPALRLSGNYIALTTFGFGQIIYLLFIHLKVITGGAEGLMIKKPNLQFLDFSSDHGFYYLIALSSYLLTLFAINIVKSKTGRAFISLYDSPFAAQAIGVNLGKFKIISFMLSTFYAGVAGGLFLFMVGFVDPENFGLGPSVEYIAMIVVGGLSSIPGSIIGPAVLILILESLQKLDEYREIFYGIFLLCFLIFMPSGIYGFIRNQVGRWKKHF